MSGRGGPGRPISGGAGGRGTGMSTSRSTPISGTHTGNHGSTYTAGGGGGGGNSHATVSKFQYMPGGQGGGGGGWARPTAGEGSSISGRIANTTAATALRCSQGFMGHLLSVAFCVEILRFVRWPGARFSADVATRSRRCAGPSRRIRVSLVCCHLRNGWGAPDCHGSGTAVLASGGGRGLHWIPSKLSTVTLTRW